MPTAFGVKKLGRLAEITDTAAEVRERSTYFNNIDKVREDRVVNHEYHKKPGRQYGRYGQGYQKGPTLNISRIAVRMQSIHCTGRICFYRKFRCVIRSQISFSVLF